MLKPTIDIDIIPGILPDDLPKALVSIDGAVRIQFERVVSQTNQSVWRLCQEYAGGVRMYEKYQEEIDQKLAEAGTK